MKNKDNIYFIEDLQVIKIKENLRAYDNCKNDIFEITAMNEISKKCDIFFMRNDGFYLHVFDEIKFEEKQNIIEIMGKEEGSRIVNLMSEEPDLSVKVNINDYYFVIEDNNWKVKKEDLKYLDNYNINYKIIYD